MDVGDTSDHLLLGNMADLSSSVEGWADRGAGEEDKERPDRHPKKVS